MNDEYIGAWPENDYRKYLIHWGKNKSHKYISRKMGSSGKWVYTYPSAFHTPGTNSKEDGEHQRIPKRYHKGTRYNKYYEGEAEREARAAGEQIRYFQDYNEEMARSNATMSNGRAAARAAETELIKARRNGNKWNENAQKAEKEYKKRLKSVKKKKRKEKIRNFLSNFGL